MEQKNQITCSVKGHETYDIQFVCLQKECEQNDRFLCKRCCFLTHFKEHSDSIICIEDLKDKYKPGPASEILERIFKESKLYKTNLEILEEIEKVFTDVENNLKQQINKIKENLKQTIRTAVENVQKTNSSIQNIEKKFNELSQSMLYVVDDFILGKYDKQEMERQMNQYVAGKDDLEQTVKDMHRWISYQDQQLKIIDNNRLKEIQQDIVVKINLIEKELAQQLQLDTFNYEDQLQISQRFGENEGFWFPMVPAENLIFEQQNRTWIDFFKSKYGFLNSNLETVQHKSFFFNNSDQRKECQIHSDSFRKSEKVVFKIRISQDLSNFNFGVFAYAHKDQKYFKNLSGNQIDPNDKTSRKNFLLIKDDIRPLKNIKEFTYYIYINIQNNQFIIKDYEGNLCLSSDHNFLEENDSEFWCLGIRTSCRSMQVDILTAYICK